MSINCYAITRKGLLLLCSVMLFTAQSVLGAASGTLRGKVYDKDTKDELPGATVLVKGTSIGAPTDINGAYTVYNVPVGDQTIVVSYVGYAQLTVQVSVADGQTVVQDFYLASQAVTTRNVVVTAQAQGQMQSINQQLSANQLVNVVSAEKMQELPDANIAESIGRLPGVSLQRSAGEANAVVIRGLSPKYNEIEIEGVPMSSTYYADRGVDLSLLGDNLVKGVEVSKTLMPNMDADALGGTVNLTLKTADPGLHYNLWGNGGYNHLGDSYNNYKFSASVGDRFLSDKIGVLLQGNIEEKQLPSDQLNAGYDNASLSSTLANTYYINTNSTTLSDIKTTRHRYGASLILDYTSDLADVKLFNVYDQKGDSTIQRDNKTEFESRDFHDQVYANYTKTEQETHSLQALFKLGETELPISLSYTKGTQHEPNAYEYDFFETAVATAPKGNQLIYAQPLALINAMGVLDPNNTNSTLYNLLRNNTDLTDESYDAKVDWKVPFKFSDSFSGRLSVGGKYHSVRRTSSNMQDYVYMWYGNGAENRRIIDTTFRNLFPQLSRIPPSSVSNLQAGIYAYPFLDPGYTRTNILGYPIGPSWNIPGMTEMANALFADPNISIWTSGPNDYNQNYTDKENSRAAYVMGEFNIGNDLTIVPGVRYQEERTDISAYHVRVNTSNANGLDGTQPVLYESKRDNPYWYPSVNIKYKATDNIQVMGAVYRSVSLPSYADISPLVELQDNTALVSGNPLLKPSTAWNYDLGTSVFSDEIGLFTVDLFYKEISDLIYQMQNYYPFAPYPLGDAPADIASRLPGRNYFDTTWVSTAARGLTNGPIPMNDPSKAYLRGIEFSWQTHLWYLPGVLSGVVLDLNLTLMSSNELYPYFKPHTDLFGDVDTLKYSTTGGALQDQPKAIYNAIVGWDYKGFSSRFSFRYQQLTLTSMDTQFGLKDSYYDNVLLVDISLKQQIIDHLSVFANATNVNNHIDNYYYSHPAYAPTSSLAGQLPTSQQTYSWALQFGLNFYY